MAEEVVYIVWSDEAIASLDEIVNYLLQEWSEKEVQKFFSYIDSFLNDLKRHPEMCRPSQKKKDVRLGILNKYVRIVYSYQPVKRKIVVLLLWNTKRNPKKFKY